MKIKLLSQNLINQIAAGEVIERPSSVIKELMENSIDAGATDITVKIKDAGKSHISIYDNGCGMDKESLELCVKSHATSKLSTENLFNINTFGFRGEALPSIASVSRMTISSACNDSLAGWSFNSDGSQHVNFSPITRKKGTTIEIRDLFFATPARLKFLKSDASELESCCNVFNRIALAFNDIAFNFFDAEKEKCIYKQSVLSKRIEDIFGTSFMENIFEFRAQQDGLKLHAFIGVPTFNKSTTAFQYFFVNNRFVKDKIFAAALKVAYAGLTPYGRYPVAVIYLDIPFESVDVNAHPAKIEVRFRESERVRNFLIYEFKKALQSYCGSVVAKENINIFCDNIKRQHISNNTDSLTSTNKFLFEKPYSNREGLPLAGSIEQKTPKKEAYEQPLVFFDNKKEEFNFGNAIHQINNAYIVSSRGEDLIIIDQHAVAERITLEQYKNCRSLESQNILLPEICNLNKEQMEQLEKHKDILSQIGVHYEKLSYDLVMISALPSILEITDIKKFIMDLVDDFIAYGNSIGLDEKINRVLSTISCHSSLRAGKKLTLQDMNYLLRQMEKTPNIAQCCHGRPSYVVMTSKDLNNLFDRY